MPVKKFLCLGKRIHSSFFETIDFTYQNIFITLQANHYVSSIGVLSMIFFLSIIRKKDLFFVFVFIFKFEIHSSNSIPSLQMEKVRNRGESSPRYILWIYPWHLLCRPLCQSQEYHDFETSWRSSILATLVICFSPLTL